MVEDAARPVSGCGGTGISAEQFALARMTANISELNHNRTKAVLEGLMIQHFENLAIDNDDRAEGLMLMIRKIWNYYTSGGPDDRMRCDWNPSRRRSSAK
ncbi:MAG: hypothetical protein IPK15_16485 [Verrucomicrobia bacterium]|nr:hypothetical protein [Verrucomicrobiota bacterium]